MSVPVLQVLYRREGDILFGWKPLSNSDVRFYKLYACATSGGVYSLVKTNITNLVDKSIYTGKVIQPFKDSDIPIPPKTYWWFKLTFVDPLGAESNIALSTPAEVRPAGVEPFFENEDEAKNNHNMAWVHARDRWEKLLLTPDGKLIVDASVTLSSAKVAARPDGTTLEYLLVDSNREQIVRIDPASFSRFDDYEETTIPPNTETDVITYTTLSLFYIEKIVCSGTSDAVFKFKVDGTTRRILRNSWNNRNVTFDFSTIARDVLGTQVVTITAEHVEKSNQNFEVSLNGFTFSII
jgi:hypothetical protein